MSSEVEPEGTKCLEVLKVQSSTPQIHQLKNWHHGGVFPNIKKVLQLLKCESVRLVTLQTQNVKSLEESVTSALFA